MGGVNMNFYNKFTDLCKEKNESPSKVADILNISRSSITAWKKTSAMPRLQALTKIAKYFDIPMNFLTNSPPFDQWELINKNRLKFLMELDLDICQLEAFEKSWGISIANVNDIPLQQFLKFIDAVIKDVYVNNIEGKDNDEEDFEFVVNLTPSYNEINEKYNIEKEERSHVGYDDYMFSIYQASKDLPPNEKQMLLDMSQILKKNHEDALLKKKDKRNNE